jgi:hypothetical protein
VATIEIDTSTLSHGGVPALGEEVTPSEPGGGGPAGAGGDGHVTATNDGGGHLLTNARIVLIFWGSAWGNPATTPSHTDFANALSGTIYGPWGTQLSQYRGIGPMSIEQTYVNTASDPQASFTDPQIRAMIDDLITHGHVPTPTSAVDRLYVVLMPTGHSSGDTTFVGQHQYWDRAGTGVYWAWVTNDGTLTGGNSIPKVFTHEVAEAVSNPDLSSGITLTSAGEGDEIGDVCNNTYSTVNGAAEEAYWSAADNRCVLPRYQAFPALSGNPALIQSRFGRQGNFELVSPLGAGGLAHFWRNDDNRFMPWSGATTFGQGLGRVDAVSMIESNYGTPGNLELVARVGNDLQFFWRDSGPAFHWNGPYRIESGVAGNPVLIQSRFGHQGNFELVAPAAGEGLVHFWRNNDLPSMPWSGPTAFGQGLGRVDAVSMIESNYGTPGNLELVARAGSELYFFWRDSGPGFHWNGPYRIEGGVAGNPVLIQSRFGHQGNFELVAPAAGAGLLHFWRNNDDAGMPWSGATAFGQSVGAVDAVSMIESNYGAPGNLEVIARVGSSLQFFWRDSGPAFHWNGPYVLQSTVW